VIDFKSQDIGWICWLEDFTCISQRWAGSGAK